MNVHMAMPNVSLSYNSSWSKQKVSLFNSQFLNFKPTKENKS